MSEFWSDCLSVLKQKLSVQQYDAWIRPLSARESDGKVLVTAPSRKALEWVREQYLPDMQKVAEQRGDPVVIEIEVGSRKSVNGTSAAVSVANGSGHSAARDTDLPLNMMDAAAATAPVAHAEGNDVVDRGIPGAAPGLADAPAADTMLVEPALSPRATGGLGSLTDPTLAQTIGTLSDGFTFDTFVTGKANQFARAAALQVGDGLIVYRVSGSPEWNYAIWPQRGEYANTTYFLTDENYEEQLQVVSLPKEIVEVGLISDGLEPLALNYAGKKVHAPFWEGLFKPVRESSQLAEMSDLLEPLENFLASDRVTSRTDDDLTLILASKKDVSTCG
jgi:hypothetical protein